MGASAALAAGGGCTQPQETIVPYVRAPEQLVPGKPLYYATAMTHAGASLGLLVETHMGRPVKVEGNPLHAAVPEIMWAANERAGDERIRFGATDAYAQAAVLSLYDPDRSQTVQRAGQIDTWESCFSELRAVVERLAPNGGAGIYLLTEPIVSPTLADQLQQLVVEYSNIRWQHYEPVHDDNARAGAQMAFGDDVSVNYLGVPEVILSLDADCFGDGPQRLVLARKFRGHVPSASGTVLPRLYVVETSSTITGASADHRLPTSLRGVLRFAVWLGRAMGLELPEEIGGNPDAGTSEYLSAVLEDLNKARGRGVVIAGRSQPPVVHAIAHWLNAALGNVGHTVDYRLPVAASPMGVVTAIAELAGLLRAKQVEALIILGGNPAYDAPAELGFEKLLASVPFSLHLSPYANETSAACAWHVPEAHVFESWSDARASDGTASIVQPLIAPLYAGKTAHEIIAAMLGNPTASSYELVRAFWQRSFGAAADDPEFERMWRAALHDGIIPRTASDRQNVSPRAGFAAMIAEEFAAFSTRMDETPLQVCFRPDPSVWDGRYANNGWLQELPRPLTKLTWNNAALVNPRTADEYRIKTGDVVEIESGGRRIEIPAMVVPGHPRETITLHLGNGRRRAGRVGDAVGTDVYPLRSAGAMWFADVTSIRNTGRRYELAATQHHHLMAGRDLVRAGTLDEFLAAPAHPPFMSAHGHAAAEISLYPERAYDGYKWGMVVNQSACVGCNACVVACQSENNIPVVGKDQVSRGREMHWLRIDNYYEGDGDNPRVYHQPVLCMHCELAPCEPVCPVAATSHSDEGLNEMTYNRCIGTRYCSNNCPYKVRRFNFYDYNRELRGDPVAQLRPNPDVTVRSRGVMEKCTYCVQRINVARIAADKEDRQIRDGELLTACQAACPTQALVFGNLNDEQSAVRELAESSLNYSLLGDLNTRPRTTYLAVVRNPNSELKV
jgi:molybdopterin-containing oxidoreductase family iron-sulfur binding subunit